MSDEGVNAQGAPVETHEVPPPSEAPDPAAWYYAAGGATVGPVTFEALAKAVTDGRIEPDTAVWRAEFGEQWHAAGSIPELLPSWRIAEDARIEAVSASKVTVNPPLQAFGEALRVVATTLFRPFSITAWLSLALCNFMASSRMMSGAGGTSSSPAIDYRSASEALSGVLEYLRESVMALFRPHFSIWWAATVIIYGLFTAFIAAKGRLLFVGKAYFPQETLTQLWGRTLGRTASLWRLYFMLDTIFNFAFYYFLYRFFAAADSSLNAASSGGWLLAAALLVIAIEIVRTLAFHFIEPLVFLLGIPVGNAARMALRAARSDRAAPLRLLAFFAIVVACRAIFVMAIFVLALVTAMLGLPPALLIPVAIVAILPCNFLIRAFSSRMLLVE